MLAWPPLPRIDILVFIFYLDLLCVLWFLWLCGRLVCTIYNSQNSWQFGPFHYNTVNKAAISPETPEIYFPFKAELGYRCRRWRRMVVNYRGARLILHFGLGWRLGGPRLWRRACNSQLCFQHSDQIACPRRGRVGFLWSSSHFWRVLCRDCLDPGRWHQSSSPSDTNDPS